MSQPTNQQVSFNADAAMQYLAAQLAEAQKATALYVGILAEKDKEIAELKKSTEKKGE